MNSTAHVRPESEISLEQGVCCAVWGRQTTMQMRANQFHAKSQSCRQHAANSQSTTTAKDLQIQYKIKMYLYRSTCTVELQDTRFIYEYSTSCTRPIRKSPFRPLQNRYRYDTKMTMRTKVRPSYSERPTILEGV